MRLKYILLLLISLNFLMCNSQKNNELESLKKKITIVLTEYDNFYNNDLRKIKLSKYKFNINGFYNKVNKNNLKDGIYQLSFGNHLPIHYFIYEKNEVTLLYLNSSNEFLKSVKLLTKYAIKKQYCREIFSNYMLKIIYTYFELNNNLENNNNCQFDKKLKKSIYSLDDLKFSLAEFLVRNKEIISIEDYYKDIEGIIVNNTGLYYGISNKDKKVDIGIYYVTNILNDNVNIKLIILYENKFKVLINNIERTNYKNGNYIEVLSEFLIFSKKNNICSKKVIFLFEDIFQKHFKNDSCFKKIMINLP